MFFPLPKVCTSDVCEMCGKRHTEMLSPSARLPAKARSVNSRIRESAPSASERAKIPSLVTGQLGIVPPRRMRWLSPRSEKTRQSIEISKLISEDLVGRKLPPIAENPADQQTVDAILTLTPAALKQQPLWLLTKLLHNVSGVVADKTGSPKNSVLNKN